MSTPEGKVKAKVKKVLKAHKVYDFWPVQTGMGAATLDCLACHKGKFFAIETKAPGKVLTDRQEYTKRQIEGAEGPVFVIDGTDNTFTYEELDEWLTKIS
jgi:hypothetical protein